MSRKKQEIYKVDWLGTAEPSILYSKVFATHAEALKFQKPLKEAILMRLVKESNQAYQWQIVPTVQGQQLLKTVSMRRELLEKGKLVNREGISSLTMTPEFAKSQKARLLSIAIVPTVLGYTVWKYKELPLWLKASLVSIGVATIYVNGRNYISNAKHNKKVKTK